MKVCRSGTSVCSHASSRVSSSDGVSSRSAAATLIQDLVDVSELDAAGGQQHRQVVEHVRGLLGKALVGFLARGPDELLGLLLDLGADQLAVRQEAAGVGLRSTP